MILTNSIKVSVLLIYCIIYQNQINKIMRMRKNKLLRMFILPVMISMLSASFIACNPDGDEELETQNSVQAVDLGLSVNWASCNIGAEFPEDYGDYYAYGEITTKLNYSSKTCAIDDFPLSELKNQGIIDSDNNLTASYDAATTKWGDSWRMPTFTEIEELVNKCTWSQSEQKGVSGYKITGPNGKSIFLPAAGNRRGENLYYRGEAGYYWSATYLEMLGGNGAYSLSFLDGEWGSAPGYHYFGCPIRPVKDK